MSSLIKSRLSSKVPRHLLNSSAPAIEDMETLLELVQDLYAQVTILSGNYLVDTSDSEVILNSTMLNQGYPDKIYVQKHSSYNGVSILGLFVNLVSEGGVYRAAPDNNYAKGFVVEDNMDGVVAVAFTGLNKDASTTLTPGRPYYVGAGGSLSSSGQVFAGIALNSSELLVHPMYK